MSDVIDKHPVESQLEVVNLTRNFQLQMLEAWGIYLQSELAAERNPSDNMLVEMICHHMVELEAALVEMQLGLKTAQALEELDTEVERVLDVAAKSANDPGLPF